MKNDKGAGFLSKKDFLKKVHFMGDSFRKGNVSSRLNLLLSDESAPLAVLQGSVIEYYHYVKSAPQHIGVAITHCQNTKYKNMLVRFFIEEHDHANLILETLEGLGLARGDVVDSSPTVGTLSLISLQSDLGRFNTLAYFACKALSEGGKKDFKNDKCAFQELAERYGFKESVFKGLISHLEEDLNAGHVSLIEEALEGVKTIAVSEADEIINCMNDMAQAYRQYGDSIADYYGTPGCLVPRPKVGYLSEERGS